MSSSKLSSKPVSKNEDNNEAIQARLSREYMTASKLFSKAIESNPDQPLFQLNLAETLFCLGQLKQSAKTADACIASIDEARLFDTPEDVFFHLKDWKHTHDFLENCIKYNPKPAFYYNAQGTTFAKQGHFIKAAKLLQDALDREPKNALYIANKAAVAQEKRDYKEALKLYNVALNIDSTAYLWVKKARCCTYLGDKEQTIRCLEKAIEVDPSDPDNHVALARVYTTLMQTDKTFYHLDEAIALDPNPSFLLEKALAAEKFKQRKVALKMFQVLTKWEPDNPTFLAEAAKFYASIEEPELAFEYAERALLWDPCHAKAWSALGDTYRLLKDYHQALTCYERAVEFNQHEMVNENYTDQILKTQSKMEA